MINVTSDPKLAQLLPIKDAGEYVAGWAEQTFGTDFGSNKYRDGSAYEPVRVVTGAVGILAALGFPNVYLTDT